MGPRALTGLALLAAVALIGTGVVRANPVALAREVQEPTSCAGTRPLPSTMYVADVGGLSDDEQLTFAALQGIVNATMPQIYLEGLKSDSTSAEWLADGAIPSSIGLQTVSHPYDLVSRFRSSVAGLVVWDPGLATDTENVATTIAGAADLLPVSPAVASVLESSPYNLSAKIDLRDEHFVTNAQAYEWALAKFRKHTRVLGWLGGDRHGLRDLLVTCHAFVFEANPEADAALVSEILAAYPPQTPVFGYPCLGDPISSDSGVPICEPMGVGEISRAGKFLIPADLSVNLSVHSAFPVMEQSPPWDAESEVPDPAKTYVTFVISDGDNIGYNEEFLLSHQWGESAHGAIPIGISISPWLGVYAPRLYNYYVSTMTAHDVVVSGPSGGGYVYPGSDPDLGAYLRQTRALFGIDGLNSPWILDNGYASSPSPAVVDRYVRELAPSGVFTDYFGWLTPNPPAVSFDRGVPVVHAVWGSCLSNTVDRIKLAAASFPTRPAFVFVALDTWQMGFDEAKQVMSDLGPGYVVVRPDQFIGLLKGAGPLGEGTAQVPPSIAAFQPPTCAP